MNLTPTQQKIVEKSNDNILVKAGPGSGKTRVIIEKIKYIIKNEKRSRILALTFSNLAADEMRNRLENEDSISCIDRVQFSTIHSFCLDIIQRRGNVIGLLSDVIIYENPKDQKYILKEIFFENPNLKRLYIKQNDKEKFLNSCLDYISKQKKKFISPEKYTENENFKVIYSAYDEKLHAQNAIDYDDILFYAYRILSENTNLIELYGKLYSYIFVDEGQDLNFSQYQIIKILCLNNIKQTMIVGDENQSIYGFNGSNSNFMTINYVTDFNPALFELTENFRSSKKIVEFANKLVNEVNHSNYFYSGELEAYQCSDENVEANLIVKKIKHLFLNGHKDIDKKIDFNDFAIIARNKYVLNNIKEKLEYEKIPCYFKKNTSAIEPETEYFIIFDCILKILINYKNKVYIDKLCSLVNHRTDVPDDNAINIISKILTEKKYLPILNNLDNICSDHCNFNKLFDDLEQYFLKSEINSDEKYLLLNDLELWKNHWNKYIQLIPRDSRSILSFRNSISLGKTQNILDDNGVSLLSVHMSKGLEYEVVFIIGLMEGTFPDYRAVRSTNKLDLDQETNDMYVAVTRAKRLCYLTFSKIKLMPWGDYKEQKKSRYLNDLELTIVT